MPWALEIETGRWRACWRDAAGRQRSRSGFPRKAEAMRYAGQQEALAKGGLASYRGRSITWGIWCDQWLARRRVERSTDESDRPRIERWLRPRWGSIALVRITDTDVQDWVNELADEMAPASVEKVYRLMSSSMKAAVTARHIMVSPCQRITLPVPLPPDERFLTRGEVDAVLHFMEEPYRTAAIVLVGTGMRFGEMAGLHWHRLHAEEMAIDVHETWDGVRIKSYPKGRRKRRVPMPSWVLEPLLEMPSVARSCGLPHERGSRCRSGLVIPAPRGGALNSKNMLRRHWLPAMERAGIDRARQHDLRHSYASWLIQAGRSMAEIAEVLGHSETTVTARYAHLAGTHMDGVRDVLEGASVGAAPRLEIA